MKYPSLTPFYAPAGGISITPEWWDAGWRIRDVPYNKNVNILTPPTNYQLAKPDFEIFVFHQIFPSQEIEVVAVLHSTDVSSYYDDGKSSIDLLFDEIRIMNDVVCQILSHRGYGA